MASGRVEWQQSARDYVTNPEGVCDAVARIAASTPEDIAIADGVISVSYGELYRRATRLAVSLRDRGVRPGDIVLLSLERGSRLVEAMIAVWWAGAAFLPVDPTAPPAWRSRTVAASGASLCLTSSDLAELPEVTRLNLDEVVLTGDAVSTGLPGSRMDDIAYVIRTSGSSGMPKLATVEHRGLTNVLRALSEEMGSLGPGAGVLHMNSPYFDMAVCEVFVALSTGARVEVLHELSSLVELVNSRGVTHALMSAALIRTLDPTHVPGLRVLMSAGAICWTDTARIWSSKLRFINGYGPSETAPCSNIQVVDPADLPQSTSVPLGSPIVGARVYLLDDDLALVPDGELGQICIAGPNVGRGYLGQAEETARCFVRDPFGDANDRMYLTGDMAVRRPGGALEFIGRRDFQVKIKGYRVELGEVERTLAELTDVVDAVAIADPRIPSGRILGYVQVAEGSVLTARDVRSAVSRLLPAYMVPSIVTVVTSWPLIDNGKVDRARLPLPR